MREQKYAKVLEDYEEETNKKENLIKEELSMTRELKFKDLQEKIDNYKIKKELEIEDMLEDSLEEKKQLAALIAQEKTLEIPQVECDIENKVIDIKEESLKDNLKEEEPDLKEISSKDLEDTSSISLRPEEELYLTTAFQPLKKRFKLKKACKVLFLNILLIGFIGLFIYFVGLPLYKLYQESKPKIIFDNTVNSLSNSLLDILDLLPLEEESANIDFDLKVDTNIPSLSDLNYYTFGYNINNNPDKEQLENTVYIKNQTDKLGLSYIIKKNNLYTNYSNSEKYIDFGNAKEKIEQEEIIKYLNKKIIVLSDLKYVITKETEIIKELLEPDLIKSSKDEIEVNDKTVKVTKNTFHIEAKEAEKLSKKYIEKISSDNKLLNILAKLSNVEPSNYIKNIEEKSVAKYNKEYKLNINIYTNLKNEVIGIDIEENGFRNMYLYKNKNEFNLYINLTNDEECLKKNNCNDQTQKVFDIKGKKEEDANEIKINYNKKELATIKVKDFSYNYIDCDYTFSYDEVEYSGIFTLTIQNKNWNIDYILNTLNKYIKVNGTINRNYEKKEHEFDELQTEKYTKKLFTSETEQFNSNLRELNLYNTYDTWYELLLKPEELFLKIKESN